MYSTGSSRRTLVKMHTLKEGKSSIISKNEKHTGNTGIENSKTTHINW